MNIIDNAIGAWVEQADGSYSHPNGARVFQDEQSPTMGLYDMTDPMRRGWSCIDPTLVGDDKRRDPHRQYCGPYPKALDLVQTMVCPVIKDSSHPPPYTICGAFKTEFYVVCDDCWLPEWVKEGAVFAATTGSHAGQSYRIVSIGSSNRFTYPDIGPLVIAEPIAMRQDERFRLPNAPAPIADVARSLQQLFRDTPQFTRDDMFAALHLVPPVALAEGTP